jgi:hypothetical protein
MKYSQRIRERASESINSPMVWWVKQGEALRNEKRARTIAKRKLRAAVLAYLSSPSLETYQKMDRLLNEPDQ